MSRNSHADIALTLEALREILHRQGYLVVKPAGGSMGGCYQACDAMVIEPLPARPLPAGAIVVFPRQGQWIAHRVLRRSSDPGGVRYHTCGDAACKPDRDLVTHDTAIGVVTEVHYASRRVALRSGWQPAIARLRAARSTLAVLARSFRCPS